MAISSTNYVGVRIAQQGQTPSLVTTNLCGLVISGATMADPGDEAGVADLKEKYTNFNAGEAVALTAVEASTLFGVTSAEKNFATGYFGYGSPSGLFPQTLYFAKYIGADPVEAAGRVFGLPVDFGSFTFLSIPDSSTAENDASDIDNVVAVANLNSGRENKKLYIVNFIKSTGDSAEMEAIATVSAALNGARGCCLVYGATEWSSFMPMAIMAAQNILTTGLVPFMYNQFTPPTKYDVPTVSDDNKYSYLSSLNVNFLGRTQVNGQTLDFFQRGYATDGSDLTEMIAANYLESVVRSAVMNLFLNQVLPATSSSVVLIRTTIDRIMASLGNANFYAPITEISDSTHAEILEELVTGMGASLADVTEIEGGLTAYGYGIYVKVNGKAMLGSISGGKVEPSLSFKVLYTYAGAVRFIDGIFKAIG